MLPIQFPDNSPSMRYEYHRVREGPNYFVSYYKHSSRLHYDPKNCWRTLGVAKFTDTGKTLKQWCTEMDETYGSQCAEGAARSDTSFASEASSDADTEAQLEPNDETKMIT
jgi:hypothetical protein